MRGAKARIGFLSALAVVLATLMGETCGLRNVAVDKNTDQSSTYLLRNTGPALVSSLAVDDIPAVGQCDIQHVEANRNGLYYSHTRTTRNQWWRVDLGTDYYIYNIRICNRGDFNDRLSNIYVLSRRNSPDTSLPPPNRRTWFERSYKESQYGLYEDVPLYDSPFLARHVAILNAGTSGVTLREVEIYGIRVNDISLEKHTVSTHSTVTITLTYIIRDPDFTESARLSLLRDDVEVYSSAVTSGYQTVYFTDSDLSESERYSYKLQIISNRVVLKELNFTATTLACSIPDKLTIFQNTEEQFLDESINQVKVLLKLQPPTAQPECFLRYNIYVNEEFYNSTSGRNVTEFSLVNLTPNSDYMVRVTATLRVDASSSGDTSFTTIQGAPGDGPGGISIYPLNTECVTLKWTKRPEHPYGLITRYKVLCSSNLAEIKREFETDLPVSGDVCGFLAGDFVECRISAVTNHSLTGQELVGVAEIVNTTTKFEINIPPVSDVLLEISSSGFVEIPLPEIDQETFEAEIEGYRVIVSENKENGSRVRREESCNYPDIDPARARSATFDPLLIYSEARACGLDYYLAAKLDSTIDPDYKFPVGDGETYGGVANVPIDKESRYSIFYGVDVKVPGTTLVVVQVLENSKRTFKYSDIFDRRTRPPPNTTPKTLSSEEMTALTVGISLVCVITTIAVVTILLIRKRNRVNKNSPSPIAFSSTDNDYTEPPTVSQRPSSTLSPPVRQRDGKPQKNGKYRNVKGDYENCPRLPSPTQEESEAIPVDKLKWYIETNKELILRQYEKLKDVPVGDTLAANLPENKSKCRYKDLYPVDDFRVRLSRLPSQGTDFINASHIAGYKQEEKYIAAQGPTNLIVSDFWLMIWQQNVYSIVMATRAFEANKMKCVQYWPLEDQEQQTYADITVTNVGQEQWPDYVITQLKVTKGGEEKWLTHYQFISWPDHDVPDTSNPFLTFYRTVKQQASVKPGPLLIHCSAGVGRTGAIIALDYLLDQAKEESKVDIYKCVVKMRERRPNMIQTEEQYIFVHRVLYDAIATEGFPTQLDMLPHKIDDTRKLKREFQYIEGILSKVETITDSGRRPENTTLNRNPNILPDDKYRIYLNSRDGQTYINAVRVNGYRKIDQFYATQIPLERTVKDFWQLAHERSCKVIVQLGDTKDNVQFYPRKEGTGYSYGNGAHTVTTKSITEKGALVIYQLEHATEKRNFMKEPKVFTETSEICLIKLPKNLVARSPMQPTHMISIAEQIVKLTERSGDINVLVTSSDGAELCGMFICGFNCLESIRLTQEVEVYSQVLQAKHRRQEFIATLDEYKHIYEILGAYVDQFSQYQNVSSM